MNVKTFNRASGKYRFPDQATVRISKGGVFHFNSKTIFIMGMKVGDKINILQDERNLEDWYVEFTDSEDGLPVRQGNGKGTSLIVNSSIAAMEMFRALKIAEQSVKFMIGSEPIEGGYWAIITRVRK